jgi:hypothetical protein
MSLYSFAAEHKRAGHRGAPGERAALDYEIVIRRFAN